MNFNCPTAVPITVKEIVINLEGDVRLTTTCRYRWNEGNTLSPYSTNAISLDFDTVSLFAEQTGQSSFGTLPALNSTVTMSNRQGKGQTYVFDSSKDEFKYLTSDVNYNEADLNTLLPLLNVATPITQISAAPFSPEYEASFDYTVQKDYMYLVWDLRRATPISLCYDNISGRNSCCDCV